MNLYCVQNYRHLKYYKAKIICFHKKKNFFLKFFIFCQKRNIKYRNSSILFDNFKNFTATNFKEFLQREKKNVFKMSKGINLWEKNCFESSKIDKLFANILINQLNL